MSQVDIEPTSGLGQELAAGPVEEDFSDAVTQVTVAGHNKHGGQGGRRGMVITGALVTVGTLAGCGIASQVSERATPTPTDGPTCPIITPTSTSNEGKSGVLPLAYTSSDPDNAMPTCDPLPTPTPDIQQQIATEAQTAITTNQHNLPSIEKALASGKVAQHFSAGAENITLSAGVHYADQYHYIMSITGVPLQPVPVGSIADGKGGYEKVYAYGIATQVNIKGHTQVIEIWTEPFGGDLAKNANEGYVGGNSQNTITNLLTPEEYHNQWMARLADNSPAVTFDFAVSENGYHNPNTPYTPDPGSADGIYNFLQGTAKAPAGVIDASTLNQKDATQAISADIKSLLTTDSNGQLHINKAVAIPGNTNLEYA